MERYDFYSRQQYWQTILKMTSQNASGQIEYPDEERELIEIDQMRSEEHSMVIKWFPFYSEPVNKEDSLWQNSYEIVAESFQAENAITSVDLISDDTIEVNRHFSYPVIMPSSDYKPSGCIILLHGLNERHWEKYLGWADYLAAQTGKPVLLFPIAYHMNRAPVEWSEPRRMLNLVEQWKRISGDHRSLSTANAALSVRLSQDPTRFYTAGKQTGLDIVQLVRQIKSGQHPLFHSPAKVDIVAYSIGSFLAEIVLMAEEDKLFDDTRLFVFCGGSVFKHMSGDSRYIMDKGAFDTLLHYYCDEWWKGWRRRLRV